MAETHIRRSALELLLHELGHGYAALALGASSFALSRRGSGYYTCTIAGGFETNRERAIQVAAGPLVDLLRLKVVDMDMSPDRIAHALRVFLASDDDGSTDCDAARFERFYMPLGLEDRAEVILRASRAALSSLMLANVAFRYCVALAAAIEELDEDHCILLTSDKLDAIARGEWVALNSTPLERYLNTASDVDRAAAEQEARDEAMQIIEEMQERGEMTDDFKLTESGMLRLSMNESAG